VWFAFAWAGAVMLSGAAVRAFADGRARDLVPSTLAPLAIGVAAAALALFVQIFRASERPEVTGAEGLVGEVGVAATRIDERHGYVNVLGERWKARAEVPIEEGREVRITAVVGLVLRVRAIGAGEAQLGERC
jgi:membrane-bound ClpP family serine protease